MRQKSNQRKEYLYSLLCGYPADHGVKIKENEKGDKYLDFARELEKAMTHEVDGDTYCKWYDWNDPQKIGKRVEELEIGGQAETI